ncbi:MAG: proton-conducting transporter membrane subunit [Dehalococcoidia bacterium]
MSILVGLAILFPIIAGLVCLPIKNQKARGGIVCLTAAVLIINSILFLRQGPFPIPPAPTWDSVILVFNYVILAIFLFVAIRDIAQRGISRHNILTIVLTLAAGIPLAIFEFSWAPHTPLEVTPALYIDHLSIIMCLTISIIGSLICVYAIRYMKDHEEHRMHLGELKETTQPRFFFFMLMFLGAMNGLVFANNLLWLGFFWEMTTLACWGLISHDRTPIAITNAFRAFWMCLIGSVGFSLAIMLLWNGSSDSISLMQVINNGASAGPLFLLPFALLCLAGFTKAAQLPFQSWLLGAMVAPTPVSALLHSSTMVNAGVYLVLRIAPGFQGTHLSTLIAIYGGAVFLATAILAISQSEAKKVLAYSTIGNLGLIILCAGINTPLAIAVGIMLLIFHAISKGLLFLCAGAIEHHIWSRNIEDMEGIARNLPLLTGITIAGMLSMLVAPFGVLIAKWGAMEAASSIGVWSTLVLVLLMLGSGATTVFWAKWIGRFLCHSPVPGSSKMEPFIPLYHGILLMLITFAVAFSILIAPIYNSIVAPALTEAGYNAALAFTTGAWFLKSPMGIFAAWPIFIIITLALLIPALTTRAKPEASRSSYMCGENVEIGVDEFVAVADERTELKTGGFYIENVLGEGNLNRFVVPVGIVLLVILFIVAMI